MVSATLANQVFLIVAGLVLFGLAIRTYRMREKPTATSFAVLLSLLGATAFCTGVTATSGWPNKMVWLYTNLAIPIVLVYFSFDYFGLELLQSRERIAAISTPAMLGGVGGSLIILGTDSFTVDSSVPVAALGDLPVEAFQFAGTLNDFGYYYTAALVLVAVGLVFQNVVQYDHLDTRLGVVIAFIGAWPWLGNFVVPQLKTAMGPLTGLVALSTGYVVSAGVAALVVGPLGLFRSSPAAGNVGPEMVLDSMHDAVLMVDGHERVLRVNAVACETFDIDDSETVGRNVADVLGKPIEELTAGETATLETRGGEREFDVTQSKVRDRTGSERGYVLVMRDVTAQLTREQRLAVLNRVLRHNLRNDATSILARAEMISADGDRGGDAEQIIDKTRELIDTAERAREIESMMSVEYEEYRTPLQPMVERVVDKIEPHHPEVEITTALPDETTVGVDGQVLDTVLYNLVENAAVHNDADDPIVVISAEQADGTLTLAVSDNGPGIPDHELDVIEAGTEDQLEHGSGLGLWAVQWGITQLGGELSVSENEPRGSTVSMTLPAEAPPDGDGATDDREAVLA